MFVRVYILLVVVSACFESILACNGYTFKLISFKNCIENSVIRVPNNFEVTMDKDCNLVYNGCVNVTKLIKTSPGTYSVKKAPLPPIEGEIDYCEIISQNAIPTIKQTLEAMGAPTKCPIPAKSYCADPNKKVSIALFKNQLGLAAGTASMKITADHDSGPSCVELSFNLSKARKG